MRRDEYKGEIGSEFWQVETGDKIENISEISNIKFLMSGRTAIDFVIKEIKTKSSVPVRTALLPSYCCHTMIAPFIANGIEVQFYDVFINEKGKFQFKFDYEHKYDIVLLMQYFGFAQDEIRIASKNFKLSGTTVIEDLTHSMFSHCASTGYSDYTVGSFRKWSGFSTGGFAKKNGEEDFELELISTSDKYLELREIAKMRKQQYFFGTSEEKSFLQDFADAENAIEYDYNLYSMDHKSFRMLEQFNITLMKLKRRSNAKTLISNIDNSLVSMVFDTVQAGDCPLFVPIMVTNGKRDELRNYLIHDRIYCPVHWPVSVEFKNSTATGALYTDSISLVCDQRYDEDDMRYLAQKINEFGALK